jgi:hypothetical protein
VGNLLACLLGVEAGATTIRCSGQLCNGIAGENDLNSPRQVVYANIFPKLICSSSLYDWLIVWDKMNTIGERVAGTFSDGVGNLPKIRCGKLIF